ncbi:hypothetical protein CC78DRAFT_420117, partial [Lojkania enalia]
EVPQFPAGTPWDIILNYEGVSLEQLVAARGEVIDIDLMDLIDDNNTSYIMELKKTKSVICYFSAGSREDWRKDAMDFTAADIGKEMRDPNDPLEDWPGENWIDVKSTNVRNIMKARIEKAAKYGCSAIDPDNVDGYDSNHQDGYTYDKSVYAEYVNYLAGIARDNNLAIGLKNALDIIPDVQQNIQFAVNEQCHEKKECQIYESMTKADKAVFNIEY